MLSCSLLMMCSIHLHAPRMLTVNICCLDCSGRVAVCWRWYQAKRFAGFFCGSLCGRLKAW